MNEGGTCTICQRSSQRFACERCEHQMRLQLQEVLDFQAIAADNLLPGQGGDGRASERGLGVNIAALDLVGAFDAIAVLESWERMWREDYGLTPYGPASAERLTAMTQAKPDPDIAGTSHPGMQSTRATLVGIVNFLQSWLSKTCSEHPAVDEFARELRTLHRACQQAAGQTRRAAWRVTCPADTDQGECGKQLRVSGQDFGGHVSCRACGTTWPVERLLRVVASSQHAELWLDPEAASEWLGISERTLRLWAREGRLKRANGRYEVHSLREAIG